jgi:hypothetical protein
MLPGACQEATSKSVYVYVLCQDGQHWAGNATTHRYSSLNNPVLRAARTTRIPDAGAASATTFNLLPMELRKSWQLLRVSTVGLFCGGS